MPGLCHLFLKDEKVKKEGKRVLDGKELSGKLAYLEKWQGCWGGLRDEGGFVGCCGGRAGVGRDEWNNPPRRQPAGNKKGQDRIPTG